MVVVLGFKIEWASIFQPDAKKTERAFSRILKAVNEAMAEYWHKNILPRHFKKGAQDRYGYQERTEQYLRRKARRFGRSPEQWESMRDFPLAFSGNLRRRITRFAQVKAFPTRFTVKMFGPFYVGGKPKSRAAGGGRVTSPNMEAEITTLLDSEREELRQHAEKMIPIIVSQESRRVQKKTLFFKG